MTAAGDFKPVTSWMTAWEIEIIGVFGLIAVIGIILSYTKFRYSWIVFVSAFPCFYLGIFYSGIGEVRRSILYSVIFFLLFATSAFALARWFYKRPHKNACVYTIGFLLVLCSQFPLYSYYKEGADRSICIMQMTAFGRYVPSYCSGMSIQYWGVIDVNKMYRDVQGGVPQCPSGGKYERARIFHKEPTPLVSCSLRKHHRALGVESVEDECGYTFSWMRVELNELVNVNSGELAGNIRGQSKKVNAKEFKIVTMALKTATFTRWASVGEEFLTSASPSVFYFDFLPTPHNGNTCAMLSGDGKTLMWNSSVFALSDEAAQQILEVLIKSGWK